MVTDSGTQKPLGNLAFFGIVATSLTSKWISRVLPYAASLALVALAAALAYASFDLATAAGLSLIFLIAVVISANRFGLWPAVFTSFLSVLCWDYFFTRPYYSLEFADPRDLFALIAFLTVSLVLSGMTAQIRRQSDRLATLAQSVSSSYSLSQSLSRLATIDELASFVAAEISTMFRRRAVVLLVDHGQNPSRLVFPRDALEAHDTAAAEAMLFPLTVAPNTEGTRPSRYTFLPFDGRRGKIGVIGISSFAPLSSDELHQVDAFLSQAGVAIERAWLARDIEHARVTAETERIRNALLTSVSHDLRTPLTTIIGALSMLKANDVSPSDLAELIATARGEAERLNRFVGNLLDITRLESRSLTAKLTAVDVGEVIDSARERARPLLERHTLDIDIPPDLSEVSGDFALLDQVIFNVLDNAAKYAPPNSTISIRAAAASDTVLITVSDEGCGIPSDALEKVFEKFSRFDREDTVTPGTGLGLMICRGFLSVMGGTIAASNRTDRTGAVLSIRLPRAG